MSIVCPTSAPFLQRGKVFGGDPFYGGISADYQGHPSKSYYPGIILPTGSIIRGESVRKH